MGNGNEEQKEKKEKWKESAAQFISIITICNTQYVIINSTMFSTLKLMAC